VCCCVCVCVCVVCVCVCVRVCVVVCVCVCVWLCVCARVRVCGGRKLGNAVAIWPGKSPGSACAWCTHFGSYNVVDDLAAQSWR